MSTSTLEYLLRTQERLAERFREYALETALHNQLWCRNYHRWMYQERRRPNGAWGLFCPRCQEWVR